MGIRSTNGSRQCPTRFPTRVSGVVRPISSNTGFGFTANHTMAIQIPAYGDFYGIRVGLYNADPAATLTVDQIKVAAPAAKNVLGSALSWKTVLTGGATSAVVPAATGTVGDKSIKPDYSVSDFLRIHSVPRSDIPGAMPLLHLRALVVSAMRTASLTFDQMAGLNALAGLELNAGYTSGDAVTTTPDLAWLASGTGMWPAFVEFYYEKPVVSMVTFGDSTILGAGSVTTRFPVAVEAARLAYATGWRNVLAPSVGAVYGQLSGDSRISLEKYLAKFTASACYIHSRSPNDYATSYAQMCEDGYGSTLSMIQTCLDRGITPIVATPLPKGAPGTTIAAVDRAILDAYRAKVLALRANPKIIVVDASAVLADLTTWNFRPGYTADGTHQNDAGIQAEGAALFSAVKNAW